MTSAPVPPLSGLAGVELVLAAAGPVSLDALVAAQLARPAELWAWLGAARARGAVVEVEPGTFAFADADRQAEVLGAASREAWAALTSAPGHVAGVLANARRAVAARHLAVAEPLYRALAEAPRALLPDGARGWAVAMGEAAALRLVSWLDEPLLDEALEVALEAGDVRLQASLAAARGFAASRGHRAAEAHAFLERALEAAEACGDRAVLHHVHLQVAFAQILEGASDEALATFERLLGDVPGDLVPLPPELSAPGDALPDLPIAVLFATYAQVGQYARGIEGLHRMIEAGARAARPELSALAQAFLSGVYAGRRDVQATIAVAEPAWAFWSAGGGPYFLWHTAMSLAWARLAQGRADEACAVLEEGQRARLASGVLYVTGSALLETLDRLEATGRAAPRGLELTEEVERARRSAGDYMRGVGLRFAARLRVRAGVAEETARAEVDRMLAESAARLRASRASPLELARALEDGARWAAARGRDEQARRLEAESAAVFASVGLGDAARAPRSSAALLVELGRLSALSEREEGAWGELAARLCAVLQAERCLLLEAGDDGPRVLAARGGGPRWAEDVTALARAHAWAAPAQLPAPEEPGGSPGLLLAVPFASERVDRRGWVLLENRHGLPAVDLGAADLLDVLAAQLGVLLENVTMWRELGAARARLERENRFYRAAAPPTDGPIVGDSPALRRVLDLVSRVAPTAATALVTGETGVGKELVAREIHRRSNRSSGPFIAVHVAALAPGLVASGLFGHERGAFTGATERVAGRFELADRGTLFLDEVGELGAEDQVRLLRVLQEGVFERVGGTRSLRSDFRLVAATNRDLAGEVRAGRFREDLYFRLAGFPIHVPPLRERREEIPTLALHFMEATARKLGLRFEGISEADIERLVAYRWPGNVRELAHVVERAALLSEPPRLRIPPLVDPVSAPGAGWPGGWVTLEELERRYLRAVIGHTRGRVTGAGGAAELLALPPSTFAWRVEKLGLKAELQRVRVAAHPATARSRG